MHRHTNRFLLRLVAIALPVLAACGDSSGGVPDPREPYGIYTPTTIMNALGQMPTVSSNQFQVGVVGEKSLGGRTFSTFKVGYDIPAGSRLDETSPGFVTYISGIGTETLTVGGFQYESGTSGVIDPPAVVALNPPLNVPQTRQVTATLTAPGDPTPRTATVDATYSLVAENVTVASKALGSVTGCRHFQGTFTFDGDALPEALRGYTFTGEVWVHPSLGVIDAKSPELGVDLGQEGSEDWGEPVDGVVVGRKIAIVDSSHTELVFSTHDRVGEYDADMCQHAKMLAEFRWADETDAKTRGVPDPMLFQAQFNGWIGSFCYGGCPLVASPVSIFHPEDNGKGYTFWYAYVSQGQKNQWKEGQGKETMYEIKVITDPSLPALRVTTRISYALVSESSDCSM
jgi:hypothetical protein